MRTGFLSSFWKGNLLAKVGPGKSGGKGLGVCVSGACSQSCGCRLAGRRGTGPARGTTLLSLGDTEQDDALVRGEAALWDYYSHKHLTLFCLWPLATFSLKTGCLGRPLLQVPFLACPPFPPPLLPAPISPFPDKASDFPGVGAAPGSHAFSRFPYPLRSPGALVMSLLEIPHQPGGQGAAEIP